MIPKRLCEHESNQDLITILYFKKPTIIEKLFFRKMINKPYKIDLDEIGSFIWGQINAVSTIREIIDISKKHFGEKVEPAQDRVLTFFRQMYGTKLIMLYQEVVEQS